MYFLNCGSITRRFSGLPALNNKYYPDSPNLILIPEYLFDKGKIREHQKAMGARVEKLARPAMKLTELEKER